MVLLSLQRCDRSGVISITEVVLLSLQKCDRWCYCHYRSVTGGVIVIRGV